ncbi:MAG: type II toxin-antitoxin system HicB family antitoxin [Pyramidobacter sp.]|nr:type II toxin-antitoxin system HicB family antitoxin [Pyramidobacter sp.]
MKYMYNATFTPNEDGGYYARVPDLPGCITTGKDLADAIDQIGDAMSAWLVVAEDEGLPIAAPTPQDKIVREPTTLCSIIKADTLAYRARTDSHAVRKNVSLPAWMSALADKLNINYSQLLQEALRKRLERIA